MEYPWNLFAEGSLFYLYVAKCGPFYKVGQTGSPATRVATLATGCPLAVTLVDFAEVDRDKATKAERRAHQKLERFHHRGEWFRAPANVVKRAMREAIVETWPKRKPTRPWEEMFPVEANGVRLTYG